MQLQGSQVLITGASSGIGKAAAQLFAEHGAQLILLARSTDKLKNLSEKIYAAARGALRTFTYALQNDLHGSGVKCLHFVPGKVDSDYFSNNPGAEERVPKIDKLVKTLTPEDVAGRLYKSIQREKRETVFPLLVKLIEIQGRYLPRLTNFMVRVSGHKRVNR